MPHHERTQLEYAVIQGIISRPDLLQTFSFWDSDFQNSINLKVYQAIKELHAQGQNIDTLALGRIVDQENVSIAPYVDLDNWMTSAEFKERAKTLREDTIRTLLFRRIEDCGDSYEYMNFVDGLRQANVTYKVDDFEKEFQAYLTEEFRKIQELQKKGMNIGIFLEWKHFVKKVVMMPGDLVIIGARPSVGKTAFALNVAVMAALYGQKVLFVSMEMNRESIFARILANRLKMDSWKIRHGLIDEKIMYPEIKNLQGNFFFQYAANATTDLIAEMAAQRDYDLIVVDYLQLLKDKPRKNDTEPLRLGRISARLKAIAGERKTVLLAPSQLSRDSEKNKREPNLADLRDSGAIEQDADTVLLIHRESRETPEAKVIVAKNRNGSLGALHFAYNPAQNIFKELDKPLNLP